MFAMVPVSVLYMDMWVGFLPYWMVYVLPWLVAGIDRYISSPQCYNLNVDHSDSFNKVEWLLKGCSAHSIIVLHFPLLLTNCLIKTKASIFISVLRHNVSSLYSIGCVCLLYVIFCCCSYCQVCGCI